MTDTSTPSPLGQLQSILLATDASENSQAAESAAMDMAVRCSAQLRILRVVVTAPEEAASMPRWVAEAGDEAQTYMDALKTRGEAAGLSVETHVRTSSDPYGEIATTAQKLGGGLIVIGRHERSEFARLLKGQTLGRLIDKAQCSVMVMPADSGMPKSRILVATDGSAPGDAAVAAAIDLAERCALPLTALSVHPANAADAIRNEAYEAVSRAQDAAGELVEFDGRCLEGKPDETILAVAEEIGADLIVMGSNARGGLGRLIKGSVAERVVARAPCAVLIAIGD